MLSIEPLKSAEGASDYYLGVVNYYQNDSQSIRWLGEGAKILGIHGQKVEKEQMLSLLKGTLPDGRQLGKIDKQGIHHRPGFDMTLSAPKSFSILLESGADPRLVKALDQATDWFVQEIEKEFAQARVIVNGKIEYQNTENLVIAAFRQPNSRENDPQSHVHLVVQNMTHCNDGKWRSLASDMQGEHGVVEQIMKHHIYGGLKFRNKLAQLTQDLGYSLVSNREGFWEISGVPEAVIQHFSKRREAIENILEEKGWKGAKASSIAAKKSRTDKTIVNFEDWKKDIVVQCKERNFDPHHLVQAALNPERSLFGSIKTQIRERFFDKEKLHLQYAKEAVHVAMESISQYQATFEKRTLKTHALKHNILQNRFIDGALIDKVIDTHLENQALFEGKNPYTQKPFLTTPWHLKLESQTINRIERGKNSIAPICTKNQVRDFIKEREQAIQFSLSPSQKKAMSHFLTSSDRFIAIQGYAGTGKTTMLRLTKELATLQGYTIRGITAGSSAANELRVKGNLDATTFARELGQLEKNKTDLGKTIFVVDEASMLSNPQGFKIVELIEKHGSQLKIIGDRAQLPSPSSGKLYSIMQDYGIDTVAMTDILRQTNPVLREAALHASQGEIYDAVHKLNHSHEAQTYAERIGYIAEKWLSHAPEERKNLLCFAPTHKNRENITNVIRAALTKNGELKGIEHYQKTLVEKPFSSIALRKAVYYAKGDIIRFNQSLKNSPIRTGDYWRVGDITSAHKRKNSLPLINEDGKTINLKLSALPAFNSDTKDLERPVEIYQTRTISLMAGDKIQWKRNQEKLDIRNMELATIQKITPEGMEILLDNQKILPVKHGDKILQHIDHGYVLTTYASQGKDRKRGISLLDSKQKFATSMANFYVGVTRATEEMEIVTDDKNRMIKAIAINANEKYAALDFVNAETLKRYDKENSLLQSVIDKKFTKDAEWNAKETIVNEYAKALTKGQTALTAKIAYTIVQDPILYKLAKARLDTSVYTFRKNALRYETAKKITGLSPEEKNAYAHVNRYVSLNRKIAAHLKIGQTNSLQELVKQRNTVAGFITNNLEKTKPWLKHFSIGELNRIGLPQELYEKESLKALNKLTNLEKHANNQPIEKIKKTSNFQQKKTSFVDAKAINESLMANPEQTYTSIWGEPKSKNARELRYSGGILVTLQGKNKGLWHDFSEGIGGNPIQAIMTRDKLDFKAALQVAAHLAGMDSFKTEIPKAPVHIKTNHIAEQQKKIKSAKSIWESTIDLKGTLGEKYLKKHRGISGIKSQDIRFWPQNANWIDHNDKGKLEKKINKIPALVIAARNAKNEITAVQRIYLDKVTANKNRFMDNPKLSKGILDGSCGIIQKGMRGADVYIAEGPETAASIAMADNKATVLVSFGVANIKNLVPVVKKFQAKNVILAADNDGLDAKSGKAIARALEVFKQENISVRAIFPESVGGKAKTDWNDVLLSKGVSGIKQRLFKQEISLENRFDHNSKIEIEAAVNKYIADKEKTFSIKYDQSEPAKNFQRQPEIEI